MAAKPERPPVNFVHQQAIMNETIGKELRNQVLYTNYSVNPFNKNNFHTTTSKVNSQHDSMEGEEDPHFKQVIRRAQQEPVKKYMFPQTEAQEVGWITRPLIDSDRSDRRLCFARQNTAITKFMDAVWMVKEQSENMQ